MTPLELATLLLAAAAGGAVQSALGFGAAVMTVPALAVVAPELLPVASLFAMLPLITTMAWQGRGQVDRRAAVRMLVARVPGVAIGSWIVLQLDTRAITVLVAAILLLAVASMAQGWTVPITPRNQALAGFTSGVTGTSTGLGGPPVALLYRTVAGPSMRATLAVVFLGGVLLSLSSLAGLGEVSARHANVGLSMGAATVLGLVAARPLVARLEDRALRRGVLAWAAIGAVVAAVRAAVA